MRHFRAQGFIPTAQWITLQHTKGRRDTFFKEIFALNTVPDILVSNLQRESLQTGYRAFGRVFTPCHIFLDYPVLSVL